jgi:hypothetical protein
VEDEPLVPKYDYYLDESDPDILLLRRQDGSFAAAFSAQGATRGASGRPPRETTGGCSRRTRSALGLLEDDDRQRSA